MSGHLRQRGKGWELIAYSGRHPRTGRKTYARQTFHGTKREANAALNRFVVQVEDGLHQLASGTVGDLLDRWIEMKTPDWSPSTTRQHLSIVERHLKPQFGKLPLRKLRAVDIDGFYANLRRHGGAKGKPLASGTVLRIHVVLHSALQQAVKWGWLSFNPAAMASPPPARQAEIKPPAPADLARLLAHVDESDSELAAFLRVSAFTGARRSQVCGLQWHDIDFEHRTIAFARGVVDGPDGIVVKDTKNHRTYVVAASSELLDVLRSHRASMAKRSMACGAGLATQAFVFSFADDCSAPWRPDYVTHQFSRRRKQVAMTSVRLHDLRHFVATELLAAGVPVTTVAGRLGHARAATTLNVYGHFVRASDRAAADLLTEILRPSAPSGEAGAAS